MSGVKNEPFLGRIGASAIAAVSALLLSFIVSGALNAPKEADERISQGVASNRAEISGLRDEYNDHKTFIDSKVAGLEIRVNAGVGDRFTGNDWVRENRRIEEIVSGLRRDIERLERANSELNKFLTEERRIQDRSK